jgi:hypothetical protein
LFCDKNFSEKFFKGRNEEAKKKLMKKIWKKKIQRTNKNKI